MSRHHFVLALGASFFLAGCMGGSAGAAPPEEPAYAEPSSRASAGGEPRAERPRADEAGTPPGEAPTDRELVSSLAGEWQLADPDAEERTDAAIAEVTRQMSFFARDMARDQIDESVNPDERVRIEAPDAEHVVVTIGDGSPARMELNGPFVRGTGADGRPLQSRAILEGGRFSIEERNDQGTRVLTLQPRGDELVVSTRITSEQLPAAIEYDLRYRRRGGPVASR